MRQEMTVVEIDNICSDFFRFWERAWNCDVDEQKRLWQVLYEAAHQDVLALYYSKFGHAAGLDYALGRYAEVAPAMRALVPRLEEHVAEAAVRCAPLFGVCLQVLQRLQVPLLHPVPGSCARRAVLSHSDAYVLYSPNKHAIGVLTGQRAVPPQAGRQAGQ
jgi:hypothetical protein